MNKFLKQDLDKQQ